jgi:hypothetical protein
LNYSLVTVAKCVSSAAIIVAVLGTYLVRAISPKLSPLFITPTFTNVENYESRYS